MVHILPFSCKWVIFSEIGKPGTFWNCNSLLFQVTHATSTIKDYYSEKKLWKTTIRQANGRFKYCYSHNLHNKELLLRTGKQQLGVLTVDSNNSTHETSTIKDYY